MFKAKLKKAAWYLCITSLAMGTSLAPTIATTSNPSSILNNDYNVSSTYAWERKSSEPMPKLEQLPPYFKMEHNFIFDQTKVLINNGVFDAATIFNKPVVIDDFIKNMTSDDEKVTSTYWYSIVKPDFHLFTENDLTGPALVYNKPVEGLAYHSKFMYAYKPQKTLNGTGLNVWLMYKVLTVHDNEQYIEGINCRINGFQKSTTTTTLKPNASLKATGLASEFNDDKALALLNQGNNLKSVFEDNTLPEGALAQEVTYTMKDDTSGTISFKLNKYYKNGKLENNPSPTVYTINVIGFKPPKGSATNKNEIDLWKWLPWVILAIIIFILLTVIILVWKQKKTKDSNKKHKK